MQGETKTASKTTKKTASKTKPCDICFEKNKYRKINCGFCDFYGCSNCVKQFILFSNDNPKCPKCNHVWDLEFCTNNLTKSFMNKDYKTHKKNLLFDIEKSKIPNTMNEINRLTQIEEYSLKIEEKYTEYSKKKKKNYMLFQMN